LGILSLLSKNIIGVLVIVLLTVSVVPVGAVTRDEARAELARAFVDVRYAESSFAYVGDLVDKLNTAAHLLDVGGDDNVAQASALISAVLASTPSRISAGSQYETTRLAIRGVLLAILIVSALLVYFYGSRLYWGLWLRSRGKWRVERA
jgi:hypothetical protein